MRAISRVQDKELADNNDLYMGSSDFDSVMTIAAERDDIIVYMSSTPTGKRGKFYEACTNKELGYSEHYHPSYDNPNWNDSMEEYFRRELTEQGYIHEIEADFGTQEAGVFNKDRIDESCAIEHYAYDKLTSSQERKIKEAGIDVLHMTHQNTPPNPFRCIGVDFDKYGASSSILVLDFDIPTRKFKVIKRIEVPRSEYSYDAAVNLIIQLNAEYNPSWIYCDRGSAEYQIERLHIYGDQYPESGLKHKVKGWRFNQSIEIIDPVTKETVKEPMKAFMVNQLVLSFDRNRMMLSPYDDVLKKQLIDYEVIRESASGPVFTDKNEHFVDALGLAHLAFVLEFPDLSGTIETPMMKAIVAMSSQKPGDRMINAAFADLENGFSNRNQFGVKDKSDHYKERQKWHKVDPKYASNRSQRDSDISRRVKHSDRFSGRSMW